MTSYEHIVYYLSARVYKAASAESVTLLGLQLALMAAIDDVAQLLENSIY